MGRRFATGCERRALPVLTAAVVVAAVLTGAATMAPAGAAGPRVAPTPLYAYAGGSATSPTSCPADITHNPAVECSLAQALTLVGGHVATDQLVYLATPGSSASYVGNWSPDLANTTAADPLVIQPAPGLVQAPVLDGNSGLATGCATGTCNNAILTTVGPGHLSVSGCTMQRGKNTATGTGGAIDNRGATVDVASMTFLSDSSTANGGAIDSADGTTGTTNVSGSTFAGDSAGSDGGAIDNAHAGAGTLTVTGSTFTSDSAGGGGGAIANAGAATGAAGVATATVSGSTFTADSAGTNGGAIDSADSGSGNVTVSGSTITANTATINGGGIDNADHGGGTASVTSSTIMGNTAGSNGGGIDNGNGSTGPTALVVKNSTLTNDTATQFDGGGIDTGDGGGGPITTSVTGSTLSRDRAGADGGGIDNGDGSTVKSTVTLADSTLTVNTAVAGGAIANAAASGLGSVVVSSATVSANVATTGAGIDNGGTSGSVAAAGDLLADTCAPGASGWTDAGYNAGDATCLNGGPGSVVSATVGGLLGPLAANGGPTATLLPLTGNAGIGLVPASTTVTLAANAVALCPTTDQRGTASLAGRACAAGAVQVAVPIITSASRATFVKGAPGSFTVRSSGLPAPTVTESGPLPTGVTLTAGGLLSGTPVTSGSFPVTLTAHNSTGPDAQQSFTLTVLAEGYWLVGGDGGIFTFGSASFHGSTGGWQLQRPVVAITPTTDRGGYWLVASDGGIFAFGDAGFHGSIPGIGLAPAGTPGASRRLNAPIVGMVPSIDGGGYFMVAADGGIFAFGDARFVGSCPGIGGCAGSAVAVVPDATGNGYWVVTGSGSVYAFGDAPKLGQPGPRSSPVTSAVRTPDGRGYWILYADGYVFNSGTAVNYGSLTGLGGPNPATAVFATSDGAGYWIATANGSVHPFGDAAYFGDMSAVHLNAPVIAASGF